MARGRKPSQPDVPADLLKGNYFTRLPPCGCCIACFATPWSGSIVAVNAFAMGRQCFDCRLPGPPEAMTHAEFWRT